MPQMLVSTAGAEKKSLQFMMKNAEITRLRRILLPILYLKNFRRRRRRARLTPFAKPTPPQLTAILKTTCPRLAHWPETVLLELAESAFFTTVFENEIIAYEDEPVRTHGLILLLSGTVGVMPDSDLLAEMRARSPSTFSGRSPRPEETARRSKCCSKNTKPVSTIQSPAALGEILCLTDGVCGATVRAISEVVEFATINVAAIRSAIANALSRAAVAATFSREVRVARKAMLQTYFHQTAPLMLQCWVCADMSTEEIEVLISRLVPEVAIPGDDIVTQGAAASTMYFIRRGSACIIVGGRVVPNAVLSAGKSFGEMGLLFHERRMATVRATTVCDLWVLTKSVLESVIGRSAAKNKIISTAALMRTRMIANNPKHIAVQALTRCAVLAGAPPEMIQDLVAVANPHVFTAGSLIASASTFCDSIVVLQNGIATSQDVFGDQYTAGATIGACCVRPHRHVATIAATAMVDAFVISRKCLITALQKYDWQKQALLNAESVLRREGKRRGVDVLLDRVPREERHPPSELSVGSPPRPLRQSVLEARRQKYMQTDASLQRNAGMVQQARSVAERAAATFVHQQPDAARKVQLPDLAAHEEVITTAERDVLSASMRRALLLKTHHLPWNPSEELRELMATDHRFIHDLAHLPSHRHFGYAELATRLRARKRDASEASKPMVVDALPPAVVSTAEIPSQISQGDLFFSPGDSSVFAQRRTTHRPHTRPLYVPIRPNSYAPVLPQSVQPLTQQELHVCLGSMDDFGPTLVTRNSKGRIIDDGSFNSAAIMDIAPPPGARKFIPTAEEVDEFMAEILSHDGPGAMGAAARSGISYEDDAATDARDYLTEAWADINAQFPVRAPGRPSPRVVVTLPTGDALDPRPLPTTAAPGDAEAPQSNGDVISADETSSAGKIHTQPHEPRNAPRRSGSRKPAHRVQAPPPRGNATSPRSVVALIPKRPVTIHDPLHRLSGQHVHQTFAEAGATARRRALSAVRERAPDCASSSKDTHSGILTVGSAPMPVNASTHPKVIHLPHGHMILRPM